MQNKHIHGTKIEQIAIKSIGDRLPSGWSITMTPKANKACLTLKAPDGCKATLTVITRKNMSPRDIANLLQGEDTQVILFTSFLSPRTRDLIVEAGASYADTAGNLRLVIKSPAVFLESNPQDKNPEKELRVLQSLKGAAAGRVVRALCDFKPPYGVRTLWNRVGSTSLGTVSRVVTLLEEEALLTRDEKKQIINVDWVALINRWSNDYSITGSNIFRSYIEPRGLSALTVKLQKLNRYAVTGALAGPGIAPARLGMIYVEDIEAAAHILELTPTETGTNVWLLEPFDQVVFDRTESISFGSTTLTAVAPSQVAVDLMTSPGRGPQEAQTLIEKMKGDEDAWRKS